MLPPLAIMSLAAVTLWFLWRALDVTFTYIDHWQARAEESAEDAKATKGKGSSELLQPSSSSSLH